MAADSHPMTPERKFPSIELRQKGERARMQHLVVVSFGTQMGGDVTLVGGAAERYRKGPTHSKMHFDVKPHYHKTGLLPSRCAGVVKICMIMEASALLQSFLAWPQSIKCNIECRKADLHKRNKRETNKLSL